MITQTPWIERSFNFDFPVGLFPTILERVRGTPARLEELLKFYPQSLHTRRISGGWSMQEHAGHLYDLDELHDGRLDDFVAGKQVLRAADIQNKKTSEARHNENSLDAILRNFRSARHHFVYRLENLPEEVLVRTAEHPRLKRPMRLVDMVYFVAEHDDHHLARISAAARYSLL